MTGNRFGNGIEFREGEPIQLLEYKESSSSNENFGKIALNPEALDILRDINEPLAIVSVVGSYRRGKSWFANVLHGRHDGFDLGAKVEGCTRGIYMWSPPFKLPNKQPDGQIIQTRVIVLDSEGIDDPKQDQNWATKLFILCLAVSSTFIYNINGIVGRDDIGKLYLMTDLSKFIQEPEDGDFLPRLVILLRDFSLENPESFKDYFLEKLDNVNPEAAVAIGKFFCDFDVYGLSHPGCRKKMLQHLENVDTEDLDDDFVEEVEHAVKSIYSRLPLKYIGSSTMKGLAFVKFLKDIVERMNSSETSTLLSIPSEYESIIQFVAQEAIKEANEMYENEMNDMLNQEGIPMLWEKFDEIHDKCISDANKLFYEKIIGNPTQMEGFFGKLNEITSKCKELLAKRNSEELKSYNENLAKTFWEKYVKIGLTQENLFESTHEFQEALKAFETAYQKTMMASPESAKVIVSYMQDQYPAATDYMEQLGRMNAELARAMHAKEEAEKLRLESLAREEEFRREIEAQKRERQENERNFQAKISELQTNVERQQKSHEEMRQRLIEDREQAMENYNQKIQEILSEQQRQQEESEQAKMELIERQQEKFNEMQRNLAEQNRKANEQLRNQLTKDKNDAIAQQNKRFKEEIDKKNRETQELINKMRRENQSKKKSGPCVIA